MSEALEGPQGSDSRIIRTDLSTMSGKDYPALGPRVWGILLRNEWFKARRRPAFYITLGFFAFVTLMENGDSFLRARRDADFTFGLPEAWSSVFSSDSVLVLFFGSIAMIMLVSSEFTWRTARQNVIDGLSKTQWFWGKVMLLPLLGLLLLLVKLVIGGGAALLGTDVAGASGPVFPLSVLQASGALLLAFFSIGGMALLFALAIRNSGPAMAVWFFWVAMGEQLVPQLLGRAFPALRPALGLLPFNVAQQVMRFASYDAPAYERLAARALAADEAVPELPNLSLALGVNAGWALLFLIASYVFFRRRDL